MVSPVSCRLKPTAKMTINAVKTTLERRVQLLILRISTYAKKP